MDPFDPRTWPCDVPYRPIWLDVANNLFAVVDVEDYEWALQWQWRPKPNSRGKKFYAVRSYRLGGRGGRNVSVFLHKSILLRSDPIGRTARRKIADHQNGQSLDCRRSNLRWASARENNMNLHGSYAAHKSMELAL